MCKLFAVKRFLIDQMKCVLRQYFVDEDDTVPQKVSKKLFLLAINIRLFVPR